MRRKNSINNTYENYYESTRILAKGVEMSNDTRKTKINNNDLIIGASGSGKTTGYVIPNLLTTRHSMVIADTKSQLYDEYIFNLKSRNFKVYKMDFVNPERSATYNPLDLIERFPNKEVNYNPDDILAITEIMCPITSPNDSFWVSAAQDVIAALIAFTLETKPENEQHFGTVVELNHELNEQMLISASLYSRNAQANGNNYVPYVDFFEDLDAVNPKSFAVAKYKDFKNVCIADKTWIGISQFVSNALSLFSYPGCKKMFTEESDFNIRDLATEKTVLFVNVSDTTRTAMDKMVNLFYTQLFQVLTRYADKQKNGRLPIPVRIILDDFASNVVIPNFDKTISVIRSREIYVSIVLQSLSQLESMYDKCRSETIINNCAHVIVLQVEKFGETKHTLADIVGVLPETILQIPYDKVLLITTGMKPKYADKIMWDDLKEIKSLGKQKGVAYENHENKQSIYY